MAASHVFSLSEPELGLHMCLNAGAYLPSCAVRKLRRSVRVRADEDNGDSKAPKSKVADVSPEKLRAAVEKLKADGVDDKVARKVCVFATLGRILCCFVWHKLTVHDHVQLFVSGQWYNVEACCLGTCGTEDRIGVRGIVIQTACIYS